MKHLRPSSFVLASLLAFAAAYTAPDSTDHAARGISGSDRRAFVSSIVGTVLGSSAALAVHPRRAAAAADGDGDEEVYFGAGCFWHVQHELASAEQRILDRPENAWTSLAGYAGGSGGADREGRVCYHNLQSVADYGRLGHGEVVGLSIPPAAVGEFAAAYFALFGDAGERADPMDAGGEYRALLGLPGGRGHPEFARVAAAAGAQGMTLVDGRGSDPDTLGTRRVYVMDSRRFPFYQAEFYHQYHNDFLSPPYGKHYHDLAEAALDDGRISITGCPDTVRGAQTFVEQNEALILIGVGLATIGLVLCGVVTVWSRPQFLYMPIYDNNERDPDADARGAEMV